MSLPGIFPWAATTLAVARAMMISPSVLVLDEPTSSLDQTSKESLLTMLRSLAEDTTIDATRQRKMLSMADHFSK